MVDTKIVKILIRNLQGDFLVYKKHPADAMNGYRYDLPGDSSVATDDDLKILDRHLQNELNIFLQTQDAIKVGFDVEYEPGEGLVTRVLYLIKINQENPPMAGGQGSYEWVPSETLRGFEPPFRVLIQTALDFYLPPDEPSSSSL